MLHMFCHLSKGENIKGLTLVPGEVYFIIEFDPSILDAKYSCVCDF